MGLWEAYLTDDERERRSRFRFQEDRDLFLVARAVLRWFLGRWRGERPEEVRFVYNGYGKPALAEAGAADLRFNVSHSARQVAWAFASGFDVGIDVERIRPLDDLMALAGRYFAPAERGQLAERPESERVVRFFELWTLKEAFVKARGTGLSMPLDRFHLRPDSDLAPLGDCRPWRLTVDERTEAGSWTAWQTPEVDGFAGGLAVQGTPSNIRCRELSEPLLASLRPA